jgi:hypothetical protein
MGYTIHHTISVTSRNADLLREAHSFAVSTGARVSEIVPGHVNNVASFFVAPDGSKEGWNASDNGDKERAQIKDWLLAHTYSDGSTCLDWFEVEHPEDRAPRIVDHHTKRRARRLRCAECGRVFERPWPESFHYWYTRVGTRLICHGTYWRATPVDDSGRPDPARNEASGETTENT